ncbi:MAG: protein kinase domain-containing protein [Hyphomicrobium sp.]
MTNLSTLPEGTELADDFRVVRVLGAGGFGVTYLADEAGLSRQVTIKEYFPSDFASRGHDLAASPRSENSGSDYKWGLERFIEEAQTLARFNHPHIVKVYRIFRANNTAYMVLHFEQGQSLKSWLKTLGRAPRQKELDRIIAPLLEALETIHKADFLHRDIAPDNIIIRAAGDPVLIDFGAARGDIAAHSKTKTVSALVKPGYSPYEQYAETSRQQGPWTDIYALAATLYHAVTGKRPPDSPSRMLKDECVSAREAARGGYRASFLAAIDRGLALAIDQRPQSVAAWRGDLLAPEPKKPSILQRMRESTVRQPALSDAAADALLAPLPAVAPAAAVPPPPDAPGPKGVMLDFLESLKRPAVAATPTPVAVAATPATPPPAAAAAAAKTKKQAAKAAANAVAPAKAVSAERADAKKAAKPEALTKAIDRRVGNTPSMFDTPSGRRRARSKPAPDVAKSRRLTRGLRTKIIVAAALTGAFFGFEDQIRRAFLPQISGITTGAITASEPAPNRTVHEVARFKAHSGPISAVSYSGDGRLIVTISTDSWLRIWHSSGHTEAGAIYMQDGQATSLSVRNNRALTSHGDGSVNIWDLDRKQRLFHFKRNDASIWAASFTGSEDRIAAGSHDWTVALWQTSSEAQPSGLIEGHENAVQALASEPTGRWLASGSADRSVKLWNLDTGTLKRTYRNTSDFVSALAFAADGGMFAAGGLDGMVRLWPTTSSRALRTFASHGAKVTSLAFSPDGRLIASAAENGSVRVRGIKRSRLYWSMSGLEHGARAVAFTPDSRTLATGGEDGTVILWSLPEPMLAQR